ncbi:hypothetical protein Q0Z83_045570 [Actinoplanes sichuanensis]|uniref:Caspase family protein n=1 Tax=Actinoplanes sichuanensis TaxID=512349 RepID=A0ABW4AB09_9ACTN|nr:caspase family protein [Actinoplanes sichuanensis]BEL06366.1 hypothetical protein Q0Z83_045570 [Actinoplanes sichuanensis]
MARLYALLVGVDRYQTVKPDLSGCANDVELAANLLRERIDAAELDLKQLCNEQATRTAVIDAFRSHLGQAGPQDTALFWFSGHGSTAPLPAEIWSTEESGECQTTVLHDSRTGTVPDLYDKELALLADEVVAGGALMLSILDSCHSRSGMRGEDDLPPRLAPALKDPPAPDDLLPGLLRAASTPGHRPGRHITLAACQEHEVANETHPPGTGVHGAFSHAIGQALSRVGPTATYRDVWSHAHALVGARFRGQSPSLEVSTEDLADREFLGGTLRRPAADVTMRHHRGAWEVNVGTLHGLVCVPGEETTLAVYGVRPIRQVRVVRPGDLRSLVEPIGWEPEVETQYRMILTEVPFPPVTVALDVDPDLGERISTAVHTAGPGGRPSPHIRIADDQDTGHTGKLLRVHRPEPGDLLITSADRVPLTGPLTTDTAGVTRTVDHLEHIARWLQIRTLNNPRSALDDRISLEIVPARPGERTLPADREALPSGRVELHYLNTGSGWTPPSVFVRIHNTGPNRLYCVLLDLTDQFRMDPDLFDGAFVRSEWAAVAGRGGPITMSLPPDRPIVPGSHVTDWFLLLASEEEFSSESFYLPRLGEAPRSVRSAGTGLRGVLGRLGLLAARRDGSMNLDAITDWTAKIVEVRTSVPEANRS